MRIRYPEWPPLGGLLAFSLLALSGALACGEQPSGDDPLDLDERVFLLESSEGFEPVADTDVRLSFRDGELSVSAGCNSQGGPYELKAGQLVVDGLGSTLVECSPELAAQDDWLATFLHAQPGFTLAGTTLTLRGQKATLVFVDREVADPDRPLAGAPWTVTGLVTASAITMSAPTTTLQFSSDGNIVVEAPCHTGSGRYSVSGERLTFLDLTYSERPCDTSQVDGVLRAVVRDGNTSFEIEADRLTIERDELRVIGTR